MEFLGYRHRRLRQNETWRRAVRETKLSTDDLVYPMFVTGGSGVRNSIESMPDIYQLSIDQVVEEAKDSVPINQNNCSKLMIYLSLCLHGCFLSLIHI